MPCLNQRAGCASSMALCKGILRTQQSRPSQHAHISPGIRFHMHTCAVQNADSLNLGHSMLQAYGTTAGGCASFEQRSSVSKARDWYVLLHEVITP